MWAAISTKSCCASSDSSNRDNPSLPLSGLETALEGGFHLGEIERHGFTAIDLLDTVVHILNEFLPTTEQVNCFVDCRFAVVKGSRGHGAVEELFVLG
jgi:hypothetical protein